MADEIVVGGDSTENIEPISPDAGTFTWNSNISSSSLISYDNLKELQDNVVFLNDYIQTSLESSSLIPKSRIGEEGGNLDKLRTNIDILYENNKCVTVYWTYKDDYYTTKLANCLLHYTSDKSSYQTADNSVRNGGYDSNEKVNK